MTTETLGTTARPQPAPWIPDDQTFGARLALVRQRMAWGNVKEAALACGVPVESWRSWERDNAQPRDLINIASRISTRTGCDLGWLVGGSALAGRAQTSKGNTTAAVRPRDNRPSGGPDRRVTTPGGARRPRRIGSLGPGPTAPLSIPEARVAA